MSIVLPIEVVHELTELRAALDAVQELHHESNYGYCVEDCDSWPCSTAKVLEKTLARLGGVEHEMYWGRHRAH